MNIAQDDKKGKVEQVYSVKDADLQTGVSYDFGALFASRGKALLFGVTRGCIMVWDRASGEIVHGLNHGEGTRSVQSLRLSPFNRSFHMARRPRYPGCCGKWCRIGRRMRELTGFFAVLRR